MSIGVGARFGKRRHLHAALFTPSGAPMKSAISAPMKAAKLQEPLAPPSFDKLRTNRFC